nr:SH3 domain-containing protein [uncultured Desulfobulbus sp.]
MMRYLLGAIVCVFLQVECGTAQIVSVAGEGINMRVAPGTNQPILWKLDSGFPLQVIGREGSWLKVRDFEASTGWVYQSTTQPTPTVIVRANEGLDQAINVRQTPSLDAEIVAQAMYGTVFQVLSIQDSWVQVHHDQGITGWVFKELLWGSTQ